MNSRGKYWIFIVWLSWLTAPVTQAQGEREAYLAKVASEAELYLSGVLLEQAPQSDWQLSVNTPDPRITLSPCDNPLTYDLHGSAVGASNVTVKISCDDVPGWSFYLGATVDHFREVAIAARNIKRGELLTSADIKRDRRRLSRVGLSAFREPDAVVGMQAKRSIRADDIIRGSHLTPPLAVQRGDRVKVTVSDSAIGIVAAGEALSNGRVGDQIRIRNTSSDRIIRARVVRTGEVEVLL